MSSPLYTLESLPQDILNKILERLKVPDLLTLSAVSTKLHEKIKCDEPWFAKILDDFGDRQRIIDILAASGVDIEQRVSDNRDCFVPWDRQPISDNSDTGYGMRCYRDRHLKTMPTNEEIWLRNIRQAKTTIDRAKSMLMNEDQDQYTDVAYTLMEVQEYMPHSASIYYLWGWICFTHNSLRHAMELLNISRGLDPDYEPARELIKKIQPILDSAYGGQPLLSPDGLAISKQLASVVSQIFSSLDSNSDGVMNKKDVSRLIWLTNGIVPSEQQLLGIINHFGGQIPTKTGAFVKGMDINALSEFYLTQTLEDPEETRNDLAKLGFNSKSLEKIK